MKNITSQTETFTTSGDFELGLGEIDRQSVYYSTRPRDSVTRSDSVNSTLVVYIPGFGNDAQFYRKVFCKKISEKYGFHAMTVDYHCLYARSEDPKDLTFETEDEMDIDQILKKHQIEFQSHEGMLSIFERLNKVLQRKGIKERFTATLNPQKEEYQNGGILAAMDIINAIHDWKQKTDLDNPRVILIGSSYGGYLANLVSKIVPSLITAVIDNSSWAKINTAYIIGRDLKIPEHTIQPWSHIQIAYYVKSAWTQQKGLPNSFDGSRFEIRSFTPLQIEQMAKHNSKCFYFFTHAHKDNIALTEDKIKMATDMLNHGMKVHLEVYDETDVDGHYIKNMNHGMDMSMLTLFDKALTLINQQLEHTTIETWQPTSITYRSEDKCYQFDFADNGVRGKVKAVQ